MVGEIHEFRCAQVPDTDFIEVDMSWIGKATGVVMPRLAVYQFITDKDELQNSCVMLSIEDTHTLIEILQRMVAGPLGNLVLDAEKQDKSK